MEADREITTDEPITITLADGTTATGMLRMSSARPGYFWVEYNGRRKTDAWSYREPTLTRRADGDLVPASQRDYMVVIARVLLREMTESDVGTTPVEG